MEKTTGEKKELRLKITGGKSLTILSDITGAALGPLKCCPQKFVVIDKNYDISIKENVVTYSKNDKANIKQNVSQKLKNTVKSRMLKHKGVKKERKPSKRRTQTTKSKRRLHQSESTSNIEIEMSIHSDSDILNSISDTETDDLKIMKNDINKIAATLPAELSLPNYDSLPGPSTSIQNEMMKTNYQVNDNVIVRYVLQKKVDYYVGKITTTNAEDLYVVTFYRKFGRNGSLRFKIQKKNRY